MRPVLSSPFFENRVFLCPHFRDAHPLVQRSAKRSQPHTLPRESTWKAMPDAL